MDLNKILLSPPAAFVIVLIAVMALSKGLSLLSFKPGKHAAGTDKAYSCGEDVPTSLMQPDYSQFFPFAFFFTILHVFTLIIATVPALTMGSLVVAVTCILGAATGLVILFRR